MVGGRAVVSCEWDTKRGQVAEAAYGKKWSRPGEEAADPVCHFGKCEGGKVGRAAAGSGFAFAIKKVEPAGGGGC